MAGYSIGTSNSVYIILYNTKDDQMSLEELISERKILTRMMQQRRNEIKGLKARIMEIDKIIMEADK